MDSGKDGQAPFEWRDPYIGRYRDGRVVVENGLSLHYTEWNPEGEKCILLVHGLRVQLRTWDPVANLLSRRFRVISVDLRGHGDSDWSREGYEVEKFAVDIHNLAVRLNLVPFTYVGHSLGSRLGFAFGGMYPDDASSLVLCDTGPEMPRGAALFASSVAGGETDPKGFSTLADAASYFRRKHPEWLDQFHYLHAAYQLRQNWAGKYVAKADPDLYWITKGAGAREIPFLWSQAEKIRKKVLVVWGRNSLFLDNDLIARLKMTISAPITVSRPPTGHYVQREQPELFANLVRSFVHDEPVPYADLTDFPR